MRINFLSYYIKINKKAFYLAAFLSALALTMLVINTGKMDYSHPDFSQNWDHHNYISMAQNSVGEYNIAPFCWRILNPLLAGLLPFEQSTSFLIMSIASLWLASLLMYLIILKLGFSEIFSIAGILFFLSLSWITKYNIYNFWLTDPLSYFFILAVILSILIGNDTSFAIFLTLGVLAKESVLFFALLYFTLNNDGVLSGKLWLRGTLLILPAIALLIFLRVSIPALNNDPEYVAKVSPFINPVPVYGLMTFLKEIGFPRIANFSLQELPSYSYGVFGLTLSFFSVVNLRENFGIFLKYFPVVTLVYLSLLFVVNTERAVVIFFPLMIIMALRGMKYLSVRLQVTETPFLVLPSVLLLYLILKNYYTPLSPLYEAVLLIVFLGGIIIFRKHKFIKC
ncbi:MAG: hypothetical protein HUU54_14355 [Ignavibacteriaceae bacterium]|nr:hypothetical protein [Ignavibacteriaceae bacterium]